MLATRSRLCARALRVPTRAFATSMAQQAGRLRIGYVPEHFSTPLHFAQDHFRLDADMTPFPTGTGAMTAALKDDSIDVAMGLTEGFVADLGRTAAQKQASAYKLVGTYVESPLRWAINVGSESYINKYDHLKKARVGVSRIGSGSYVMYYVLANQQGWLDAKAELPEPVVLGDFAALRTGVNSGKADFFMWEYWTSKSALDSGEIKHVDDIYTPWPSWMIAARNPTDGRLEVLAERLNNGVNWFLENEKESILHITSAMDYSVADARAWTKTVEFAKDVRGVDRAVIDKTVGILQKAGVLPDQPGLADGMIGINRSNTAALAS